MLFGILVLFYLLKHSDTLFMSTIISYKVNYTLLDNITNYDEVCGKYKYISILIIHIIFEVLAKNHMILALFQMSPYTNVRYKLL